MFESVTRLGLVASPGREDMQRSTAFLYCEQCARTTQHLSVKNTMSVTAVSRSSVYFWMKRGWIHWRTLPGGHRLICRDGLSQPGMIASAEDLSGEPDSRLEASQPKRALSGD